MRRLVLGVDRLRQCFDGRQMELGHLLGMPALRLEAAQ
jgi:hypothetical protein